MATVEIEGPGRQAEEERVIAWRVEELERAGYDQLAALELALRTDVDLHQAIDLMRRGCPQETARGILL